MEKPLWLNADGHVKVWKCDQPTTRIEFLWDENQTEPQNLMWRRETKEVWKDGEEENGRFWDDESLDFPLELLQDPLQGHLGP